MCVYLHAFKFHAASIFLHECLKYMHSRVKVRINMISYVSMNLRICLFLLSTHAKYTVQCVHPSQQVSCARIFALGTTQQLPHTLYSKYIPPCVKSLCAVETILSKYTSVYKVSNICQIRHWINNQRGFEIWQYLHYEC